MEKLKGSSDAAHLVHLFHEKQMVHIVMTYEGQANLKQFLADRAHLTVGEVPPNPAKLVQKRTIVLNLAKALQSCHAKGVVHRDIKLENVMVAPDLSVRLIDFGYGKVLRQSGERLSKYCGTPYYMPPEIIRREAYNGQSAFALICSRGNRHLVLRDSVFYNSHRNFSV